ncbi:VOC family protein [Luteimonas sp. 3794]|uniref:VOC family protein n=1 Tax=Luteimonas sp. 3794 TaxID=2817730 RepID=UPI002857273D|nr:VOC family protein [Luteimonas sp. 3794]MDR6990019.1 PhnB protein [Luteimonas sp. 3794]
MSISRALVRRSSDTASRRPFEDIPMRIDPYLYFDGTCAEAFQAYAALLGGEPMLMPYGDAPPCPDSEATAPDRIMYGHLAIGDQFLMASDVPPGTPLPASPHAFVNLGVDSDAEAERIFAALSQGGEVRAPMAETFFAHRFGMVIDRFGTGWMVMRSKQGC